MKKDTIVSAGDVPVGAFAVVHGFLASIHELATCWNGPIPPRYRPSDAPIFKHSGRTHDMIRDAFVKAHRVETHVRMTTSDVMFIELRCFPIGDAKEFFTLKTNLRLGESEPFNISWS